MGQNVRLTSPWVRWAVAAALVTALPHADRAVAAGRRGDSDGGRAAQSTPALPRSTPEAQGIPSAAVLAFVEGADKLGNVHSVVLLRHGHVVAEGWWAPYEAGARHELYSLSKSFTSTAVGLAVAEGKLSVDDPVLKFFPEAAPAEPSANLKAMRVSDLLRMSTGHQTEPRLTPATREWARAFLAHPVPFKPGTHFLYNTAATYMQSAIVQRVTGQTVLDFLRPRLFEPLGIENPTWGTSPEGVSLGGYGLSVRTEDIAKFGQLYLQKGSWGGRQLVPTAWVEAATARQTSNGSNPQSDWDQGYGYQFWRCRHGAYRGDGAFGQFCIVMPERDAVVAVTSGVPNMQAVMNLVWDRLLPAMRDKALPEDAEGNRTLQTRLAGLALPVQKGTAAVRAPRDLSGKRFVFAPNNQKLEALAFEFGPEGNTATVLAKFNGAERRIECGDGAWKKGRAALGALPEQPVAASGGWTADDTYTAKVCLTETPFLITLTFRFAGDKLHFESAWNVAFGSTRAGPLVGELK